MQCLFWGDWQKSIGWKVRTCFVYLLIWKRCLIENKYLAFFLICCCQEFVPITGWTLRTKPFLSLKVFDILAIVHTFRMVPPGKRIMSPAWKLLFTRIHFCWAYNVAFIHLVQKMSDRCWARLHCFRQYRSSLWKISGGDITTLVFIVSSCIRLRGR